MPLLEVSGLTITLQPPRGRARAVQNLEFILERGATLGLIGESGCGKSLTALALMGLLPEHAQVDGSIRLNGQELLDMDERALCRLRGNRMAMVFQEPMTALNPVHGIGRQVAEPLRHHQPQGRGQQEGLDPHVAQPRHGPSRIIGVDRRQNQMACQRGLNGDGRRLRVADLADHDHVRVLTQDGAQARREGHADLGIHLRLADTLHGVFDRVFHRQDVA